MFRFFSRKLAGSPPSSGTTEQRPVSSDIPSPEAEPPASLSPPPQDYITDPKPLHALIASVPPQTLQAYTLAHLVPPLQPLSPISFPHIPLPTDPPSPRTLTTLTNFFSSLVPPPLLHCVRCHKGYFEVENTDRSCLIPHDDESAEVERVGVSNSNKDIGTEYQTLWNCCGRTVEGDGDMGPPDGWCYEGKHTTDTKRARFRADSTLHDDKLTSCEKLRCHEPKSSPRSVRFGRNKRRRPPLEEGGEDVQSVDGSTLSAVSSSKNMSIDDSTSPPRSKKARRSRSASTSSKADLGKKDKHDDASAMDIDPSDVQDIHTQIPATPKSPSRSKSRKSGGQTQAKGRNKPKAKSPLASSFTPPSPPAEETLEQREKETLPALLPRPVVEIMTERDGSPRRGASKLQMKSSKLNLSEKVENDSEPAGKDKPKPKSRARKSTAPSKPDSKASDSATSRDFDSPAKPKSTVAMKSKSSVSSLKSSTKPKSSTSQQTPSRVSTRKKGKRLEEVVDTSVYGEDL